ncbi:M23 family metallopeptidase [Olivibacter sp. SDN3]|uniref:M23 family metallopeptidase n=1 Tax=Olivibacter sp. SDN3 TaxID=2764720 RepID=UPI0016519C03|nr:M23 family metallopeptidase [Olivibacter sp. SDN3]QNL48400.1 M23 family metallopeptidase [Olivibacter sp. SDN3]
MRSNHLFFPWCICLTIFSVISCNNPITKNLFKGKYAHERYEEQLKAAGLGNTILFSHWQKAAKESLLQPQTITIPYQEKGFFTAENPQATGFVFDARQGEYLQVLIEKHSKDSVKLFIDLFQLIDDMSSERKHLISIDTLSDTLAYEIKTDGTYLLRIQPELLASISYNVKITAEPSLASPVASSARANFGSFFGDGRDAGVRKHEGVDIFAKRLTPVVAAASGRVSRVGTNNLGGKVVWLKPADRNITLYYAHLDSQLVTGGHEVSRGDTIGLMGNTGNAQTTAPHLHFGIYTANGAVDPMPFLKPDKSSPPKILVNNFSPGDTVRILTKPNRYALGIIQAAMKNSYRIVLPEGINTTIDQRQVSTLKSPLRTHKLKETQLLYHQPDSSAAHVSELLEGTVIDIFAESNSYYFIKKNDRSGWISK